MDVTFYLKSGHSFTVQMNKLTRKKSGLGEFVGLEWESIPNTPDHSYHDLDYINIDDISAIVIKR